MSIPPYARSLVPLALTAPTTRQAFLFFLGPRLRHFTSQLVKRHQNYIHTSAEEGLREYQRVKHV